MTIKLSLWSLNASHNVSMHSLEKLSLFSGFPSAYASSMKRTPPNASLITSRVLTAVCPKYPAIKSLLVTFLNVALDNIPILLYILPIILATSVFPVPGGP